MSREQFEKLFPVPEWASYFGGEYGYKPTDNPLTNSKRSSAVQLINFRLQGYQSRQPEIDELTEALEAYRTAMAMPTWSSDCDWTPPERTYFKSYDGGDCAKHGRYYGHCHCCADDARKARDRANDQAKRAREDALRNAEEKARTLIAKHKGEA